MILHLLWTIDSIYSKNFKGFVERHYGSDKHKFVVLNSASDSEVPGVVYFDCNSIKKCLEIVRLINRSEKTIVHGIFMKAPLAVILSVLANGNKMSWMIWGADLYNWKNNNHGIKAKISNLIQKRLRKKCKTVIISFASDKNEYIKQFGYPFKFFYAHYVLPYSSYEIEQNFIEKNDKVLNILIGNSANKELRHIEILKLLKEKQREDIKIHIPLNYGDRAYGDEVETIAKNMFGNKAICYRENIPIDKYIKLLWKMDIAVFYTNRQIALGNIVMLLYMGKEIYMERGTTMYECLKEYGIDIKDIEDIGEAVYNTQDKYQKRNNNRYICERLDIEKIKCQWDTVFES